MSVCSNSSQMSVSVFGDEMPIDEALDQIFLDLQSNLNSCHCSIRSLAMSDERADTFLEAGGLVLEINGFADEIQTLFRELKSVSKQLLGRCPKEYTNDWKQLQDKFKREIVEKKRKESQMKDLQKQMALSQITE